MAKIANESPTIKKFTEDIIKQFNLASRRGLSCSLIYVIDKFSKDDTYEIVKNMAKTEKRIKVFWNDKVETLVDSDIFAYKMSLESNTNWIIDINAGYRHQPKDLINFFDLTGNKEIDAVFGSRYLEGSKISMKSRQRRILSKEGTRIARYLLGLPFTDLTSGFMMLRRETLHIVLRKPVRSRYHFLQTELKFRVWQTSKRIKEVPIQYESSSGALRLAAILDALKNLLLLIVVRIRWTARGRQ